MSDKCKKDLDNLNSQNNSYDEQVINFSDNSLISSWMLSGSEDSIDLDHLYEENSDVVNKAKQTLKMSYNQCKM